MNAKELADTLEQKGFIAFSNEVLARETYAIHLPLVIRALRLLAAAEGVEGTPDQSVMEVVSTVEDIVTAARLTQFYDDPIYKPWSEQVWRSVDTARRTIATRRKVLERIATERNGLAARVAELEPDAERYRWLRVQRHADIAACWYLPVLPQDYPVDTPEQRDIAIDAARSKP